MYIYIYMYVYIYIYVQIANLEGFRKQQLAKEWRGFVDGVF